MKMKNAGCLVISMYYDTFYGVVDISVTLYTIKPFSLIYLV